MPRSGVMLATAFNKDALQKRWKFPVAVQPKYNGYRGRAKYADGCYSLFSSESNLFNGVPHINEALDKQFKGIDFDGEIYQHGRKLTGPNGVSAILKRKNSLHSDYGEMEYHIFDIINTKIQKDRIKQLKDLSFEWPLVRVPTFLAYSVEDLFQICKEYIDRGYEGIIIRQLDAIYRPTKVVTMMKLKPTKSDYYRIIGYKEELSIEGIRKGQLGSVECVDSLGNTFFVGSGFQEWERIDLWQDPESLIGKFCHVKYQELTHRGVPTPLVVLEIVDKNPEAEDAGSE